MENQLSQNVANDFGDERDALSELYVTFLTSNCCWNIS